MLSFLKAVRVPVCWPRGAVRCVSGLCKSQALGKVGASRRAATKGAARLRMPGTFPRRSGNCRPRSRWPQRWSGTVAFKFHAFAFPVGSPGALLHVPYFRSTGHLGHCFSGCCDLVAFPSSPLCLVSVHLRPDLTFSWSHTMFDLIAFSGWHLQKPQTVHSTQTSNCVFYTTPKECVLQKPQGVSSTETAKCVFYRNPKLCILHNPQNVYPTQPQNVCPTQPQCVCPTQIPDCVPYTIPKCVPYTTPKCVLYTNLKLCTVQKSQTVYPKQHQTVHCTELHPAPSFQTPKYVLYTNPKLCDLHKPQTVRFTGTPNYVFHTNLKVCAPYKPQSMCAIQTPNYVFHTNLKVRAPYKPQSMCSIQIPTYVTYTNPKLWANVWLSCPTENVTVHRIIGILLRGIC